MHLLNQYKILFNNNKNLATIDVHGTLQQTRLIDMIGFVWTRDHG